MTFVDPLPPLVLERVKSWELIADGPVLETGTSWLLPVRSAGEPLMLKVARTPDEQAGYSLLEWYGGQGAAWVNKRGDGAVLLERSVGGRDLTDMAYAGCDAEACRILCETSATLHAVNTAPPPAGLHPLETWFQPLYDRAVSCDRLASSADIARALLAAPRDVGPLHGDLHHGNILDFGTRGWLAIDPKGLLGERTFDYANLFVNPDIADPGRPLAILSGTFDDRLAIVVRKLGLDPDRLLRWIVAWTGLSAAFSMEDGEDQDAGTALTINALAASRLGL